MNQNKHNFPSFFPEPYWKCQCVHHLWCVSDGSNFLWPCYSACIFVQEYWCTYITWCAWVLLLSKSVSYSIFILQTSMSSYPLWSPFSWRLTLPVTILHCLLEEQRLRHTEFKVRTLKSGIWTWIKHKVLMYCRSCRLPFSFILKSQLHWSHPGLSGRDSLVNWCYWTENRKTKDKRLFVNSDRDSTWQIPQSKDVFVRWTWQTGEWRRKNYSVVLIASSLL